MPTGEVWAKVSWEEKGNEEFTRGEREVTEATIGSDLQKTKMYLWDASTLPSCMFMHKERCDYFDVFFILSKNI
jgi:hypothetical protein